MSHLVLDIGITTTRLGVSRNGRTLEAMVIFPTAANYQTGIKNILTQGKKLLAKRQPDTIVGGVAGLLNSDHTKLLDCQAKNWIGRPLSKDISRSFNQPVHLENDAVLNGLGEAAYGAGQGHSIVGFLTLSTGINGVRIVRGRPDTQAFPMELRHLLVYHRGRVTTAGRAISGHALAARYGQPASRLRAGRVWQETAMVLAQVLVNLELAWTPNVMILGGSVMNSISLPLVRREIRRWWAHRIPPPRLVRGILGDRSGLLGGLAFGGQTRVQKR